jgi:hypothetical protein
VNGKAKLVVLMLLLTVVAVGVLQRGPIVRYLKIERM